MQDYSIVSLEQRDRIPPSDRPRYYIHKALLRGMPAATHDAEPLVALEELRPCPFLLRPFWLDPPAHIADPALQELVDVEAEEMHRFVREHPDFRIALRSSAVARLVAAQQLLPVGLRIVVKIGYRPIEVQVRLVDRIRTGVQRQFPALSPEEVRERAGLYISDPATDVPPHATGGAVDLTLADTNGNELDFGSALNLPDDRSWTFYDGGLTVSQKAHRSLLTNTMVQAGFANLASEWWHYSYGDPRWAVFTGGDVPLYGAVE